MCIVILGASRFGTAIAETLIEAEHEVVVIDKDRERLETLAEEAGDEDTADLFIEVSRSVDNDAWFIGANADAA